MSKSYFKSLFYLFVLVLVLMYDEYISLRYIWIRFELQKVLLIYKML